MINHEDRIREIYRNYRSKRTAPYFHRGSNIGILLIHPITAAPDAFHILQHNLLLQNYSIAIPCLTGHGARPIDLASATHYDWAKDVEDAYQWLNKYCTHIFVIGISIGATLGLSLVAKYPNITGIILANALLNTEGLHPFYSDLLNRGIDYIPKMELLPANMRQGLTQYEYYPVSLFPTLIELINDVKPKLSTITSPLLLFASEHDTIGSLSSTNDLFKTINSKIKAMVILENSSNHLYFSYTDLKEMLQISKDFLKYHLPK